MFSKRIFSGVLLLIFFFAGDAFADDARDLMLRLTQEGIEAFQAEDFAEAARKFEAAYAASPDINLQKNIMLAWFKADDCPRALPAGTKFLAEAPDLTEGDHSDVRTVQSTCYLGAASAAAARNDTEEMERQLALASQVGMTPEQEREAQSIRASVSSGPQGDDPIVPPPVTRDSSISWMPVAGFTALGLGAAGMTAFLVYYFNRSSAYSERADDLIAQGIAQDAPEWSDLENDRKRYNRNQWLIAGPSGALIAAGAGMLIYHFAIKDSDDAGAMLVPVVDAEKVGVSLTIPF